MILTLVAATLFTASPALAARGSGGEVELGVYGGYGWLDDYATLRPKDNALFGARLGYFFTPQWSAEVSAQRLSTHTQFDPPTTPDFDIHLDAIRLNLLYNFPGTTFRPFLTGGIGSERLDAEDFGESSDLGWNGGAGFRWFLTDNFNLRADARFVGIKVDEIDESETNVEGTVGLAFTFGGRSAEPAVVTPPSNQQPTVTLTSDRPEILPGETVGLHATASDPDGDPLTYEWSATAGHVTGAGANTTLDFQGVTPPSSSTVTVRDSDNRGGTASATTNVRLLEPARQAEAV
jgi:outer membrane beta-barrel protein